MSILELLPGRMCEVFRMLSPVDSCVAGPPTFRGRTRDLPIPGWILRSFGRLWQAER